MKTRVLIMIGFVALVIGGALWAQTPNSDSSLSTSQAWRHLVLEHQGSNVTSSPELAQKINSLGDEGWQLVDVESIQNAGTTTKIVLFFRRLK